MKKRLIENYDLAYGKTKALFGDKPERVLSQWVHLLEPGGKVLDIGAGQGRNTLYFLENGFETWALEPSAVALEQLKAFSDQKGWSPVLVNRSLFDFVHNAPVFDAILAFGLIQILSPPELGQFPSILERLLKKGGLLFITGFGTADSSFDEHTSKSKHIAPRHFQTETGEFRFYLKPGQLPSFFPEFEVIHFEEAIGPWHKHGEGDPERHAMVEAVFKK